jgi:TPR repeat protein
MARLRHPRHSRGQQIAAGSMRASRITVIPWFAALALLCACGKKPETPPPPGGADYAGYKARAERGEAEAQFQLGLCYRKGQGVAQDDREAVTWFRKAAGQDHAQAQFFLGFCYSRGQGVQTNAVEVVKWWRQAAGRHHPQAQYNLGVCFANGEGVKKDAAEAMKWWRLAADQDEPNAQYALGVCYALGEGVEKDYVEAYAWITLAGQKDEAARKNRADVSKKMLLLQIADGEKRAKELRAQIDAKLKGGRK